MFLCLTYLYNCTCVAKHCIIQTNCCTQHTHYTQRCLLKYFIACLSCFPPGQGFRASFACTPLTRMDRLFLKSARGLCATHINLKGRQFNKCVELPHPYFQPLKSQSKSQRCESLIWSFYFLHTGYFQPLKSCSIVGAYGQTQIGRQLDTHTLY